MTSVDWGKKTNENQQIGLLGADSTFSWWIILKYGYFKEKCGTK